MAITTISKAGKQVLQIFDEGVVIDQTLPKWVRAGEEIKRRKEEAEKEGKKETVHMEMRQSYNVYNETTGTMTTNTNMDAPFVIYSIPDSYEIKDDVRFDEIAAASLKELTILIKKGGLNNVLSGYGGMHGMSNNSWGITSSGPRPVENDSAFKKFTRKISGLFKTPELDATAFFTNVKFESKESAETYRDRVSMYLKAIHNAKLVGQTALVEKLLGEMIANKYESMLYTNGCYYAIPEDRVVSFAVKTERGINLTYLKNFTRPIPQDVIDKVGEVSEYCVFDNYVVMHYDPMNEHREETKKEEAKRKDPILFGVIAGSRKLYYIADWIDEYCDLTLEKFVEALGTDKDEFLVGEKPLEVEKIEKKVKPTTKKDIDKKEPKKRKSKKKDGE